MSGTRHRLTAIFCLLTLCQCLSAGEVPAPGPQFSPKVAVLLQLNREGELELSILSSSVPLPATTPAGLLVWEPETGSERWAGLKAGGSWPDDRNVIGAFEVTANSRSSDQLSVGGFSTPLSLAATIQLEPLDGSTLIRGASFITPQNGSEILSSRPTIRRSSENGGYPERVALLSSERTGEVLLRIRFPEGQQQVALSEWTDWPETLKDGLIPGQYILRMDQGLEQNRFSVVDPERRKRYWSPIDAMIGLSGDKNDPLVSQFGVEYLLSFRDDDGQPAFLGDALDFVERVAPDSRFPQLKNHRDRLKQWLESLAKDPGYQLGQIATAPLGTDTGFESIDTARRLIASGQWTDALHALEQIPDESADIAGTRLSALKRLYRGVVFAEAGVGSSDKAVEQFDQAIEILTNLPESPQRQSDLLRANNNLANFRLLLAQNSLGNHAFQMAAGVDQPMLIGLLNLIDARQHYSEAAEIAAVLKDDSAQYAIRINQARACALLADVVQTLDVPAVDSDQPRSLLAEEQAATQEAVRLVSSVTQLADTTAEISTKATAWELLAQLSYRQKEFSSASELAQKSRNDYLRAGDLSGVETIERLLGLVAIGTADQSAAVKHLSVASLLAELQRSRFPQDQTGQSRAGYFARHSFVYEKLVELYLAAGRPQEALKFAEMAKARSAQDLLSSLGIAEQEEPVESREFSELLSDWPDDVAAVEYFLGAERSWGFLIRNGKVRAFPLLDKQGQPIATRELIARTRHFLSGIEGQAQKMLRRYQSKGFDHTWQDELYELRLALLPDDVLADLRTTSHVVVVPQHILHYLPFAALVTTPDSEPRTKHEMVQPQFVIDEPFAMTCSPSLTIWDLIRRRSYAPVDQVRVVGLSDAPGAPRLAGVEEDLKNLHEVYGDALKQVLEGNQATENRVKQFLSEPGLLMFATHGNNNPEHPLESYLMVLEDENSSIATETNEGFLSVDRNDGRLTAGEIFARRVNARVIVMSACYSGLGDRSPQPGDDLFGLQRAFLYSGARTVLSGLWDVHDGAAPGLIRRFHEVLLTGKSPSQSISQSQREFLQKNRAGGTSNPLTHPYFWSVFCVAGAE
jgi:CHAT domain-containing protein